MKFTALNKGKSLEDEPELEVEEQEETATQEGDYMSPIPSSKPPTRAGDRTSRSSPSKSRPYTPGQDYL